MPLTQARILTLLNLTTKTTTIIDDLTTILDALEIPGVPDEADEIEPKELINALKTLTADYRETVAEVLRSLGKISRLPEFKSYMGEREWFKRNKARNEKHALRQKLRRVTKPRATAPKERIYKPETFDEERTIEPTPIYNSDGYDAFGFGPSKIERSEDQYQIDGEEPEDIFAKREDKAKARTPNQDSNSDSIPPIHWTAKGFVRCPYHPAEDPYEDENLNITCSIEDCSWTLSNAQFRKARAERSEEKVQS